MKARVEYGGRDVPLSTMKDMEVAVITSSEANSQEGTVVVRDGDNLVSFPPDGSDWMSGIFNREATKKRVRILGPGDSIHFEEDEP